MADLTISPLDCEAVGKAGVTVTAILTDSDGSEVAGHLADGGLVTRSVRAVSNGTDAIVLDLTPNVGRSVTDGVVVSGDTTVTSATAVFVAGDVGSRIVGTGIPDGATIASRNSATSIEISAPANANGTGVTLRIDTGAITPANTYYTIQAGSFSFLIEKTPDAQTLLEALAEDPVDLALPVLQQTVDTAVAAVVADGDVTGPLDTLAIAAGVVGPTELAAGAATTAKIADGAATAAKIAEEVPGAIDTLATIGPEWSQASDFDPVAFDEVGISADGWITIPAPTSGPAAPPSATEGAAHGAIYKDWGAWAADDVYVEVPWSAYRPAECTPLLHVVEGTDEFGIGCWPIYDILPGTPGVQSCWWLGVIGKDNTEFAGGVIDLQLLTADELAQFSDLEHPAGPVRIGILSSGNTLSVFVNGRQVEGLGGTVPVALRGSSTHGVAVDNNQTDGTGGAGGARPANFPAGRGPLVVAPMIGVESLASRTEVAAQIAERLSTVKGGTVAGALRVEPSTPTFEPGGVQPVTALSVSVPDLGVFEVTDSFSTTAALTTQAGHDAPSAGIGAFEASPGVLVGSMLVGDGSGDHDTLIVGLPGSSVWLASNPGSMPALSLSGVNGATQGVRLVGKIATGLPTSGVAGDLVLVADTALFKLCTVTGTPGTWVTFGGSGGGGGTVDVVSNVATATLLGRTTSGSGDSEELTATQAWTILDDGSPTTAPTWTTGFTITGSAGVAVAGSGGVTVTDGTAGDGKAVTTASAFGAGTSYFGNTADGQPRAGILGGAAIARVMLGAGGSTAPSWYIDFTSAAVATMTGELRTTTDSASNDGLVRRQWVETQIAAHLTTAFDFKDSVRAATTADITLSGAQTIDGVSVVAGNRVLVKNQSTGSQNGIYVAAAGAWTRASDADASAEVTSGMTVPVTEGTANAGRLFMLTTADAITLGTTALTFTRVDTGDLAAANNLSDVANAATAFGNIKQAATTSATGVIEIADSAEIIAGTATDRAVTPAQQGMVQLATSGVLGSTQASIAFSSIPSGYSSLIVMGLLRTDRAGQPADTVTIGFNSDTTGGNYDQQVLQGLGGTAASAFTASGRVIAFTTGATATANHMSAVRVEIPAYAGATRKEAVGVSGRVETAGSAAGVGIHTVAWKDTTAISTITFTPTLGTNFVAGCVLTLYGVR